MVQVSVVKCTGYEQEEVDIAVRRSLDLIGGIERFVKPGQNVLLKVNALTPRLPEAAVTTHPVIIKSVIREVRRAGGKALVGDSSGGIIAGQAPTKKTFEVSGIADAVKEEGAELLNFDISGLVEVQTNGPVKSLHIARPVVEADVVISMPKLKTHSAVLFTGAVKNMYGCVPGFRKAEYHGMAPNLTDFSRVLVDVYSAAKPSLAIMDAVTGMEGNGPSAGNPREVGLIMASQDSVSLDAVASVIIGLNSFKVYTTALAHQMEKGQGDIENIDVLGEKLEDVMIRDFSLPSNLILEHIPGFIVRRFMGLLKARPWINEKNCIKCRFCVESCPMQAMEIKNNKLYIDYSKCISCLCCQELCPQKAVEMRQTHFAGRLFSKIISRLRLKKQFK